MEWWQALLLGLVQGLTEFLPVSSSGHLIIFKELLGVSGEGFLDFTVTVHLATVLSTIIIFRKEIWQLITGFFKFRYNDETDYVLKICLSMIPVAIVGFFFKDQVETLFGSGLLIVGISLFVTAALLLLSDYVKITSVKEHRNGISYIQALLVGIAQAFAVAPGLSRSGATIATGLVSGVKRDKIAQFSFLMVLAPIIGEQLLDLIKLSSSETSISAGIGLSPLLIGFIAAFVSGLLACKIMITIVKKAGMTWFAAYCAILATILIIFN